MGVCGVGFESSHIMIPYSTGVPPGPPVLEASGGAVLLKKDWRWAGGYWERGVSLVGSC